MVKKCSTCHKSSPFLSINLGHILIMSSWLAGILVTYGSMKQEMLSYKQEINNLEIRLHAMENYNNELIAATKDIEWIKRDLKKEQ